MFHDVKWLQQRFSRSIGLASHLVVCGRGEHACRMKVKLLKASTLSLCSGPAVLSKADTSEGTLSARVGCGAAGTWR